LYLKSSNPHKERVLSKNMKLDSYIERR
jgi:hypothetical protein